MIREGRFKAIPEKHGLAKTGTRQSDGEDIIKMGIEFKLLEGSQVGQRITFLGGFEGRGFEFTSKAMKTCGWDGKPETVETPWKYRQVYITVEQREYEKDGEKRKVAEVKYINALDDEREPGALIEKLQPAPEVKAKFMERFGAQVAANAAASGEDGSQLPASGGGAPPDDLGGGPSADDDIPF